MGTTGVVGGLAAVQRTSGASSSGLPPVATPVPTPPAGTDPVSVSASDEALQIPDVFHGAHQIYGGQYAGFWIDNSGSEPVTNVMVAGPSDPARDAAFKGLLPPAVQGRTSITQVKYTLADLQGFQTTLAQFAENNFNPPSYTPQNGLSLSIDTLDNAVAIGVSSQDVAFLAPLQALVPADALRIRWVNGPMQASNGPGWVSGQTRNTYPPYKAGLEITDGNVTAYCTSGFTLEITLRGTSYYKGITAGHCFPPGDSIYIVDPQTGQPATQIGAIGNPGIWSYGSGGDYGVFTEGGLPLGRILAVQSGNNSYVDDVVGRESNDNIGIGLEVCESGRTTNAVSCGTTISGSGTILYYGGHWVGNSACSTFVANRGDSGGPIYVPVPGAEGVAAGVEEEIDPIESCWTTIDSVLQGISNHYNGTRAYVYGQNGNLY